MFWGLDRKKPRLLRGLLSGLPPCAADFERRSLEIGCAAARSSLDGHFLGWVSWLRRSRPIAYAGRGPSGASGWPYGNTAMREHSGCSGREPSGRGLI